MSDLDFLDEVPEKRKVVLSEEQVKSLHKFNAQLRDLAKRKRERTMDFYKPYRSQKAFHLSTASQRAIIAANRSGKTFCGAMEMAYHLTGDYPDWWMGKRFTGNIKAMAGSITGELTRKGVQRQLMGPPEDEKAWGTAAIPKDAIIGFNRKPGVPNALDSVTVKHKSGGTSILNFNSYDQGASKWQADEVHVVWFDEEPPIDIYSEGVTRTATTEGTIICTFTPLAAMHDVVDLFMKTPEGIREWFNMTLDDALHLTEKAKREMLATWPAHERDARSRGIPMLGSGRVFHTPEDVFTEDAMEFIPPHWYVLRAIDFGGGEHPTAAVLIAWDKDADCIHVVQAYRRKTAPGEVVPITLHAKAIKLLGCASVPTAWPHDGNQKDRGSGEPVAALYRKEGLPMLDEHATHEEGGISVSAGVVEIQDRLETNRLKVNRNLGDLLEEYRGYHTKDGLIVALKDDLLSALRYAIMMKRYARPWSKCSDKKRPKGTRFLGGVQRSQFGEG